MLGCLGLLELVFGHCEGSHGRRNDWGEVWGRSMKGPPSSRVGIKDQTEFGGFLGNSSSPLHTCSPNFSQKPLVCSQKPVNQRQKRRKVVHTLGLWL